jgi:predicted ATP-dependent endonuclease of OLD family
MIAALRRLNGSITSLDLQMPSRDSIAVGHKVGDKVLSLDLAQESEGFRRVLAYLVALYQSPAKQVLIFEEPEKGIHPGALEVLAEQFKACPDEGRGQVILTTHSPELLDHFPPEALRVVEIVDYVTRIGPVAQDQVEAIRERLLRPGELVTVDPARLVTSDAP